LSLPCIFIFVDEQEERREHKVLRPHPAGFPGVGRRGQFHLADAVLSGDVHAEQDGAVDLHPVHAVDLLPPQERIVDPAVPDERGDDRVRAGGQLHDGAPRLTPQLIPHSL
jgi:hypothetical protein